MRFLGCYRLSGYAQTFQRNDPALPAHTFRDGVVFDAVLDLYIFERELRLLVVDAIERIEVDARVAISKRCPSAMGHTGTLTRSCSANSTDTTSFWTR
ncbi:MAG: Abi family protein [Gammaproteobacteria bacterium]|nr:Abi family protein [Gammaproteobacteria bacterium]